MFEGLTVGLVFKYAMAAVLGVFAAYLTLALLVTIGTIGLAFVAHMLGK